ncbi:hypothetical protein M0804_013406 [Polistes exclamans]|nr:hypothetical protein M0804_013406 [Polistes exclamans]
MCRREVGQGLPHEVEKIFNLEPGYSIPIRPNKVPVYTTLVKDLEEGIRFINITGSDAKTVKDEQNNVRSIAVNLISNYYKKNQRSWKDDKDNRFIFHLERQ